MSPSSFIRSKEIDPEVMPPVPDNPRLLGEHFLKLCSTRLSLALAKEKEEFEAFTSKTLEHFRPEMIRQLERLDDLLNNFDLLLRGHPHHFTVFTEKFREDISELIGERLH